LRVPLDGHLLLSALLMSLLLFEDVKSRPSAGFLWVSIHCVYLALWYFLGETRWTFRDGAVWHERRILYWMVRTTLADPRLILRATAAHDAELFLQTAEGEAALMRRGRRAEVEAVARWLSDAAGLPLG
jgi:hypothetical protein